MGNTCLRCGRKPKSPGRHYCSRCILVREGRTPSGGPGQIVGDALDVQSAWFARGTDGKMRFTVSD